MVSFAGTTLESHLHAVEKRLATKPHWLALFRPCFLNTLETTIQTHDDMTFVITGDIPAMWLRDSTAQVRPYVRFARHDPALQNLLRGVIRRQMHDIGIDAYANAFNRTASGQGHQEDITTQSPWLWERKYELDSLCYPLQLIQDYWTATGDSTIFDTAMHRAFARILDVIECEQQHDARSDYSFQRTHGPQSDTLPFGGRGTRTNFTGLSWSGFRPSDDACKFGYLIPSNMFAVVVLAHLARFARDQFHDQDMAARALRLRDEIDFGIQTYGIVQHPRFGPMYAYEVDGYGNVNLMDDANVPSLLSIPYLGYRPANDPLYRNTRAFVLSEANPYFYRGTHAQGIGSPHTPPGMIWPISLTMQALTSTDAAEREALIETLVSTTGGTGFMHESFNPDDPTQFTREWFAWANSLFGELLIAWAESQTQGETHGG